MSGPAGTTRAFAERIVDIDFADIGEAALASARRLTLDGLAVAVAGSRQEAPPSILGAHVGEMGGAPTSSVIGFGFRTNPEVLE